jgi:hypothetical protein
MFDAVLKRMLRKPPLKTCSQVAAVCLRTDDEIVTKMVSTLVLSRRGALNRGGYQERPLSEPRMTYEQFSNAYRQRVDFTSNGSLVIKAGYIYADCTSSQ